jgi:riboflavin kinase/FMN adenylyltransferase
MQIHFSKDFIPDIRFPVLTMGSFDGVHAGHRVIISRLNTLARLAGGSSVLITFDPHPRKVLYPNTAGKELRLITSLEEKCRVLEETGLDHLIVLEFNRDFSLTSSEGFVEEYLVGKLHAHTIVVGFNHFFGHNKEGDFDTLYRASERFGFKVEEISEQEIQNETVSSTKIRKALSEGHIQRANAYLEHHFLMQAQLFPLTSETILFNRPCYGVGIDDPNKLHPPPGSYAVSLLSDENPRKALVRISQTKLLFFPLGEGAFSISGQFFIQFHKHLISEGVDGIESDVLKVEELIY